MPVAGSQPAGMVDRSICRRRFMRYGLLCRTDRPEWKTMETERIESMDIRIGDVLHMKKKHPCGSNRWEVLRIGADFKLRCLGCAHEVMNPRSKVEKNIRKVERDGQVLSCEQLR